MSIGERTEERDASWKGFRSWGWEEDFSDHPEQGGWH